MTLEDWEKDCQAAPSSSPAATRPVSATTRSLPARLAAYNIASAASRTCSALRPGCHSCADADGDLRVGASLQLDRLTDPLRGHPGLLEAGLGHEHEEFIAAG